MQERRIRSITFDSIPEKKIYEWDWNVLVDLNSLLLRIYQASFFYRKEGSDLLLPIPPREEYLRMGLECTSRLKLIIITHLSSILFYRKEVPVLFLPIPPREEHIWMGPWCTSGPLAQIRWIRTAVGNGLRQPRFVHLHGMSIRRAHLDVFS